MKYDYSDWNDRSGTIPVKWQAKDYENLPWYRHPDVGEKGFTTDDKNLNIYGHQVGCYIPKFEKVGKGISIPDVTKNVFDHVLNHFDLDDLVYTFAKYKPSMILPWHNDNYPTYAKNKNAKVEEIVRIMIFLHDPAPGHQLWIKDKYCTGKAGTWYSWQGSTKHMAANLGEIDRFVLQITGKIKNKKSSG